MYTKLKVYDLDDTLIRNPSYCSKKLIEEKTGKPFDSVYSFYDHPLSLDVKEYHIQLIGPVFEEWQEGYRDPETLQILVTHRVESLSRNVTDLLARKGITMDHYYFCSRLTPKVEVLDSLLKEYNFIQKVEIFEDSYEQIGLYLEYLNSVSLEFDIWAVDKSKVFKVESLKLAQPKRIRLI